MGKESSVNTELMSEENSSRVVITEPVLREFGFKRTDTDDSGLSMPFLKGILYYCGHERFKYFIRYAALKQFDGVKYLDELEKLILDNTTIN